MDGGGRDEGEGRYPALLHGGMYLRSAAILIVLHYQYEGLN